MHPLYMTGVYAMFSERSLESIVHSDANLARSQSPVHDIRQSTTALLSLSGSSKPFGLDDPKRQPLYWQSRPTLNHREVTRWAEEFGVRIIHAQRVSDPMRLEQATLRLRTRGHDLAMKVYQADEQRLTLLENIFEMLDQCYLAGFPCPKPQPLADGNYLFVDEQFAIGIYDWLDGENLLHPHVNIVQKMTAEQARSAGALLARWHALTAGLFPQDRKYSLDEYVANLRRKFDAWLQQVAPHTSAPDLAPIIHRLTTDVTWFELVGKLPPLALQWTHGDATVRNFMFDGDEAIALIDFDLACFAPRLSDLIILMQAQAEFMLPILEGYRATSELTLTERRALPVLAGGRLFNRLLERLSAGPASPARIQPIYSAYRDVKFRVREISMHL